MVTHISKSPDETCRLGEAVGQGAAPGLIVGLIGDLGAGKTQFVKGVAKGLGVSERIHSPTFALVNEYRSGRVPCYHLDLYRLEKPEQLFAAGLDQYLYQRDGVTLVEWFDRLGAIELPGLLRIEIHERGENEREITYVHPGA